MQAPRHSSGMRVGRCIKARLSAGRARDHPVMEIVPNKALSLSLSSPVLVRTGRRLPVQALGERRVWVALTGYPRGGAPGP